MNCGIRFASHERRATSDERVGSALILTVVLTSLLAIVGVLFVMMARVNQIATSGLSESRELDSAIETVIAKISEELVLDVPGVSATNPDYYDYPGQNDKWLASLEPYDSGGYKWRQVSDVYNKFDSNALQATIVSDYQDSVSEGKEADADGDGVADSKWIELDEITSSKGKPIYAAIRVVDNGGMLNVNTAYKFDPDGSREEVDGSSQLQINLMALASRPPALPTGSEEKDLRKARAGGEDPNNLARYETDVIWQYGNPAGLYTPFDISDELELRYRFLLNHTDIDTRLEDWGGEFRNKWTSSTPFKDTDEWFVSAYDDGSLDPNYAYRHLATTYNMDRIINPGGNKMLNINTVSTADYNTIKEAFTDSNFADVNGVAAQITVNLIDFRDNDSNVTPINVDGTTYYGFEQPCVYISELAYRFKTEFMPGGTGPAPGIDYIPYRSYAIELHKPYSEDVYPELNQWRLSIGGYGSPIDVNWSGTKHFHVIHFEDPCVPLPINLDVGDADSNLPFSFLTIRIDNTIMVFASGGAISLQRKVGADWISVDSIDVPDWLVLTPMTEEAEETRSFQRDITLHKCIRRLWDSNTTRDPNLGHANSYVDPNLNIIPAHPEDRPFTNVGEIGMVFAKSAYSQGPYPIERDDTEATARINLVEPKFQQVFNYLTVIDPYYYHLWDPNYISKKRIKGRININTAPWFVLAQLPWVSQRKGSYNNTALAEAIVAYRDKTEAPGGDPNYGGRQGAAGFENIGQLCNVNLGSNENFGIDYYKRIGGDQTELPDFDPNDGAVDDFEERDLIFSRISNLVTVRSDVFTAYILVRIGNDGPQKRVIAILDRSNVSLPTDRVKIVAVHPAADPR